MSDWKGSTDAAAYHCIALSKEGENDPLEDSFEDLTHDRSQALWAVVGGVFWACLHNKIAVFQSLGTIAVASELIDAC